MRRIPVLLLAMLILATGAALTPAQAVMDDTILVSRAGGFGPKGDAGSIRPAISADGRYIAFDSPATNLDPDDADTTRDIFRRDLVADTTILISRASGAAGTKSNGTSFTTSISADGRFVAFQSTASNLHPDDLDTDGDIFVRDTASNTTTLASRATGTAGPKGDGISISPSISADGRYVAFRSSSTNLDPDDGDGTIDIFVRDLFTKTTTLVSRASGIGGAKGRGDDPSISADGQRVAFSSSATNLHPDDADAVGDVFVRDLTSHETILVSRASGASGSKGDQSSFAAMISGDGTHVVFNSNASSLDPGDVDNTLDVFVRDLTADTTTLASRATGGSGTKGNLASFEPAISADGRFVTFDSDATNLHPDDVDATGDVYVRDVIEDTTTLASRASEASGAKGNGNSTRTTISADGRFVGFDSTATNLNGADTSGDDDIYVRDILGPQAPPSLAIDDVKGREGKTGTTPFTFTVSLDGVPGRTVTVDFATKNKTATVGDDDYLFTNGTLTFPPGTTTQTIVVDVIGDKKKEKTEVFKALIFNATGAEIDDHKGFGTIKNDDRRR